MELPTLRPGKSIALIALGMGVYFVYLYHLGFQEVIRALANVNLMIFSLGIVLALAGIMGDSLAWQEITKRFDYNVPIWDIFLIYMSCIFMNNLIPSGSFSGETTRIYFLDKIAGNSRIDKSSATVATTRIITAIPFIVGTIVGLAYLALATDAPAWTLATCSGITIILFFLNVGFFGVCYAEGWLERIIFSLVDRIEQIFRIHIDRSMASGVMNKFHQSMNMLASHKRTLFISTFWAVVGWLCMTLVATTIFHSMGVSVPLRAVFAVYTVMIFLQMLPIFLPGGIGLVDIVMITLFNSIGVPMHSAVAASILIRLIQLWLLTALGGISTAYLVKKINRDNPGSAIKIGAAKSF